MEYISSDTNVWVDFQAINRLELPFRLPYTYLMNNDAVHDELLSPPGMGDKLLELGLQETELTEEEFYLVEEYVGRFKRLSLYDCVALAIAKGREITLLTGDGALRKAAQKEGVMVIGTIGILDQLYENRYIEHGEYEYCIKALLKSNGKKVRLPEEELRLRIDGVGKVEFVFTSKPDP